MNLLIPSNPVELPDVDSPKATQHTHECSKNKKPEKVQDIDITSMKTTSMSLEKGGVGKEISEETSHKDEDDPSKKRKVSPQKPLSRKKMKATKSKFDTVLTLDEFNFIIVSLNDASLEIVEKQEARQEVMYSWIKIELQGVQ
jgi:hypothetical protein